MTNYGINKMIKDLGEPLPNHFKVWDQLWRQVNYQVIEQVWNKVYVQAWDRSIDQVKESIR